DLPEHVAHEPNRELAQVKSIVLPAIVNGRISQPGDRDIWKFTAHKGDTFEFEMRSTRLGSPLCPSVRVQAESGKSSPTALKGADGKLATFTTSADGPYFLHIEERFAQRGGPDYTYRLRIDRPGAPDFQLRLASDALTLTRGTPAKLKITADRQR